MFTIDELAQIEAAYEFRFTDALQTEILSSNVTVRDPDNSYRELGIEEVLSLREPLMEECPEVGSEFRLFPLFSDDQSNFAGVYAAGVLEGKVCFIDHERSFDATPTYRSLSGFVELLNSEIAKGNDWWWDYQVDYPQFGIERLRASSQDDRDRDWSIVVRLRETRQDEQALLIMASLTPCEHVDWLKDFLITIIVHG